MNLQANQSRELTILLYLNYCCVYYWYVICNIDNKSNKIPDIFLARCKALVLILSLHATTNASLKRCQRVVFYSLYERSTKHINILTENQSFLRAIILFIFENNSKAVDDLLLDAPLDKNGGRKNWPPLRNISREWKGRIPNTKNDPFYTTQHLRTRTYKCNYTCVIIII